ncbi:MAG TPA: sigma factor-like helix-turn-helix DNA-binding protein [Clostridium sp.]|uniref:sigma factor-like helix-turn-helix DNA-binding protein n=1 Tax=Clostridium sp. TaxID=1506 RepID=UPI002F91F13A
MSNYIEMASYVRDTDFICESTLITEFVQACGIVDIKQIDMNLLRNYHRVNTETCINLIDELALRGFIFHMENPTNMLPSMVYEIDNNYIIVKDNGQRFRNINFARLGLANFVERFFVKTDYFFQYIKLDNFLHINSGLSLENLKEEFLKCGFNFVDKEESLLENCVDEYNENTDNAETGIEDTKKGMQKFFEKVYLNPISTGVTIENAFLENGFNKFRDFCEENSLMYVKHLEGFPFDELISLRGFGQFRIEKIKKRYEDFVNGALTSCIDLVNYRDPIDIGINSYYLNIELDGLKAINIDDALLEEFKNTDLRFIGDLLKLKNSELIKTRNVGVTKINRFMLNINLLCKPPEELIIIFLKTIKENKNFEIFRARSIGKLTLQTLGEQYHLTRERIRQKEKKILIKFKSFFILFRSLIFEKGCKLILDMDDIKNIVTDDEDMLFIKYALISETCDKVVYFKELDKFLVNKNLDDVKAKLDRVIEENLEDIFDSYNEIVNIDEFLKEANLEFVDIEDFITYAKKRGFKEHGNYLMRSGTSSRKVYSYILKEYFPKGVRYSDENDMEEVLKIAREDFELERHSKEDSRALSGIIGENVLCDRGRYIHSCYIDIPIALVEKIKNYIINSFEETLIMGDVFHKFEDELTEQSNINNRNFLHGVLKYYYGEELIFGRDKVSKASCEIISTNKILENFILEQGGPVTKDRIRKQFPGWSEIMITNCEVVNKNIIIWGNGVLSCVEFLQISEMDKEEFQNAIESSLSELNGYCTAMVIYKKLQLKMNIFYKLNKITNYMNLFYVLKYLFEDIYYFRIPHILREKQDKRFTTIDILIKTIGDRKVVTFDEMSDYFINKLKMNEKIMYASNIKLMRKLVEVRKGEYILKDSLKLDGEILNKISEFMDIQLLGNEYVPMHSIIDYRGLPDIGYEWNPFLLQDIIEDNLPKYKFIEKQFKDRRYRCSNILRNGSELISLVDLIIYVLNNEYNDKENMTIQAIQQYLSLKNIIFSSLPHEFMASERVSVDEFHRVEII